MGEEDKLLGSHRPGVESRFLDLLAVCVCGLGVNPFISESHFSHLEGGTRPSSSMDF